MQDRENFAKCMIALKLIGTSKSAKMINFYYIYTICLVRRHDLCAVFIMQDRQIAVFGSALFWAVFGSKQVRDFCCQFVFINTVTSGPA